MRRQVASAPMKEMTRRPDKAPNGSNSSVAVRSIRAPAGSGGGVSIQMPPSRFRRSAATAVSVHGNWPKGA